MTDTLRDQIAAAIVGTCPCFSCTTVALEKADAVIEALALRECDIEDCRCRHRYITEWTPDE
jgi:hypothetical protein